MHWLTLGMMFAGLLIGAIIVAVEHAVWRRRYQRLLDTAKAQVWRTNLLRQADQAEIRRLRDLLGLEVRHGGRCA